MQVTLPYPEWYLYAWLERATVNAAAALNANITLWETPQNERAWLDSVFVDRQTGDNTGSLLILEQPEGYGGDTRQVNLGELTTAATSMYWPDPGSRQTLNYALDHSPLLLEAGSKVLFRLVGAGAAASTWLPRVVLRRMKIIRARAP